MTSTETGATWSDRLNPRNWTLVWKLAVVGLLPALLALVLGVLRVADQAGDAADLGRSSRLLEVQAQVAGAANALREERNEATLFVADARGGDRGVLEIGFGKTDAEVSEMLNTVRSATELDATTISALQQAESELTKLSVLRADTTDNQAAGINQIRGRYTDLVEGVDVLDRALLRQLRTPGTAGLADALSAVTSADEQLAIQHTVLATGIKAGQLQPGDANAISATDNQITADYREYQVALTPDQLNRFGNFLDDAANSQRERLKASILATPADRAITLAPTEWDTAYNGSRAAAERSADLLRTELVNQSAAAEEAASNEAGIQSVILMLGLLAGITVAVLVARALIRSLRVLRSAALDVAERRLPQAVESMRAGESPDVAVDPVPITTADEVGQVARAFDEVHGQAVRLAAEQAALQSNVSAMFVNLSRRSQALVERQLQLIEQLESNEQDPDQLSNLFQLDHLATRMRRNSENLLVLAGTDLAKRNAAPIPLVDVLRAAVSEVEQYQRIVVQSPPTATIAGRAGADLVHLLAELLDNATNFSPPESQVVMSSARTSDGSVMVEISDRGVGMLDHELDDANQRLSGPSSVDVSASRRMGLFVVGRLGARHGISVRLGTGPHGHQGGLTALVTVPAYLISATPGDAGRPLGAIPAPNGLPQRAVSQSGPSGPLSALIAGTDGPSNPTSVFDPQVQEGHAASGPPTGPNGGPVLPTRRPGSTLRPNRDGPPLPPVSPGRGDFGGPADQPRPDERERAREIAEQARRDQEAAARRSAAQRQNLAGRQDAPMFPGTGPDQRNGYYPNGNGSPPGAMPPASPPAPDRAPQSRADTARPEISRQEPARMDEDFRGNASTGPNRPVEPSPAERSGYNPPPLPRRVPGMAPQPPSRPSRDNVDDGAPRSLRPEERGRTEQQTPPSVDRPLPELPQRVPPSELPRREPRQSQPGTQPPFAPLQQQPGTQPPFAPPQQHPGTQPPFAPLQQHPGTQPPFAPPVERPQQAEPMAPTAAQPLAPAPSLPSDELFAPVVPAEPQPDMPPAGRRPAAPEPRRFDPSETTPIFEEIASAWFRSNRQIPVAYDADQATQATPAQQPKAPQPVGPAQPMDRPAAAVPTPGPRPAPMPMPMPAPAPAEPDRPQVAAEPVGAVAARIDRGFATEADDGWRAASGAAQADLASELTTAGLPKRRPRARLVPGSAGSAVLAAPTSPARSAENIRGRLASYQQGVRQGRERRLRGETASPNGSNGGNDPANAGGNHDEESS